MFAINCKMLLEKLRKIQNHLDNFEMHMDTGRNTGNWENAHIFCTDIEIHMDTLKDMYNTFENGSIREKFDLLGKEKQIAASIRRRKKLDSGEVIQIGDRFRLNRGNKEGSMLRDEILDTDVFELVGFADDKSGNNRRQALLKLKNAKVIVVPDNYFVDIYKKI